MLVAAAFVEIPQAASDLGGFAQGLVKILEVKDGGALVRGDEVERGAWSVRASLGFFVIPMHALRETPGPNGHLRGGEQPQAHLAQDFADALLFGGADVGQRPPGVEDFPKHLCRTAFDIRGRWRLLH